MRAASLRAVAALALLGVLATTAGCGDRADVYDAPLGRVQAFGLDDSVVLLDDAANRAVVLRTRVDQQLDRSVVALGKNVVSAEVSSDGRRLFVLSAGDPIRRKASDESASLTVIDAAGVRRYVLGAPHSGLAIDREGRWVALYAAPQGSQTSFVENPNEIVLIDLTVADTEQAITSRTLRSFGGRPQRLSFTQRLSLPAGARRLLVVETEQDVSLLDLDNLRRTPQRPEITVRLSSGDSAVSSRPAGIVADDGDGTRSDDARIGVRLEGSSSVLTLTLVPSPEGTTTEDPGQVPNDFAPIVNLTDVGGPPSDIAFVRTEAGLRLAAVVPGARAAVLVDPETSLVTRVDLPEPYARLALVTGAVGGSTTTDTTLLYGAGEGGGGTRGVAFWSLGRATGQPYRSVEVVSLQSGIAGVIDVPPPRPQLKVLHAAGSGGFYVLDLARRTASPLTTQGTASLVVSRDGERLWAFVRGSTQLARVSLGDLHPLPLPIDRPIEAVFDVANVDGGRSLIALDTRGAASVTVLDAGAPDTAASRSYYGLLLEGLQ